MSAPAVSVLGQAIRFEVTGPVARIVLARPEAHNPIDVPFVSEFGRAVHACAADPTVRVVLIAADGPNFTVGGDRDAMAEHLDDMAEQLGTQVGPWHCALTDLAELMVPVVCAVQGAVAGGGLGMLYASDVVIAADDLRLATAFARLGISGDGGSSWALPRMVGLRRAMQLLLRSRVLDASEALEWQLVDEVVEVAALRNRAEAVAGELAAGPTVAYGHLRRLVRESWDRSWPEQLAAERAAAVACGLTEDCREGVKGLLERRAPQFRGR